MVFKHYCNYVLACTDFFKKRATALFTHTPVLVQLLHAFCIQSMGRLESDWNQKGKTYSTKLIKNCT